MPTIFKHAITLAARVLLSAIFIVSSATDILGWGATAEFMLAKGMGLEHLLGSGGKALVHVLLASAIILKLVGGLSVLLGIRARWGAVLLIGFLIPATLIFHNFWAFTPSDPQYQNQMAHFLKNVGLMGGLLMVWAFGSGGFSVDTLFGRGAEKA